MTQELTETIAYDQLQNFFSGKPMVFFGTGVSCAVDEKFGMPALKKYLVDTFNMDDLSVSRKTEWEAVRKDLEGDSNFESAMDRVTDEGLVKKITGATADFLNTLDEKYADEIFRGEQKWPAIDLFKRLVERLPETDRKLHVVTPTMIFWRSARLNMPISPIPPLLWAGFAAVLTGSKANADFLILKKIQWEEKCARAKNQENISDFTSRMDR